MSETLTGIFVDATTNTVIERDLTPKEIKEVKTMADSEKAREKEALARAAARISALAKLADLGLTAEEIAAL